jgi:hypothetical protein
MTNRKILLCISFCLIFNSACRFQRDYIFISNPKTLSVKASKNKTLLQLNDSVNSTINDIYILGTKHQDRLDFSLLIPEVRRKVHEIIYVSHNVKKVRSQLAYFPNLRHIELFIENKGTHFTLDTSFRRFHHLQEVVIGADSLNVSYLPDSLISISAGGKYLHFPYIPHYPPFSVFSIGADSGFVDFRNLENVRPDATVGINFSAGISIDSIYCHLHVDTLKFLSLSSDKTLKCSHKCIGIPFTKTLYIGTPGFSGSCEKSFYADRATIEIATGKHINFMQGEYNDKFITLPAHLEVYERYNHKTITRLQ